MLLDPDALLRSAGALAAVLLPLWLLARALRGRQALRGAGRRLRLEETLALDARRRLLIVRCDGRDALILTGGGQDLLLGWLPERPGP